MSYQKLLRQMIEVTLVLLLLVGCGAPAATSVPPAATPAPPAATPVPPTAAPNPTPEPTPIPALFSIYQNEKSGYIDASGQIVIQFQFDDAGSFFEGLAAVKVGSLWGYIDATGTTVIQPQFDSAGSFSEGLAAVRAGSLWGYIDATGTMIIQPRFERASPFYGGRARIGIDDKYGYIDSTGKIMVAAVYDGALDFSEVVAGVMTCTQQKPCKTFTLTGSWGTITNRTGGQWSFIDPDGDTAQPGSNQFVRATDVNSSYDALILRLERRFAHGLSFVAGYTFGKSIDTASGLNGTNQPQDNYNLKAERGLSDFDLRQRFVFSSTWELPFGAERRWMKEGWKAKLFGQWQLANILTLQTGQPLTAVLPTALSGTQSNGTDRPDLIANPNWPVNRRDPSRWFSTEAFRTPLVFFDALGAFSMPGNEGRNVITGPDVKDWDASLERHARLNERTSLVLRADFFNLTNHPNFDRPGLIVGTSNFGRISSAQNSRQIQFSLRLNW